MQNPVRTGSQSSVAKSDIAAHALVDHLYSHDFPPVPGVDIGTAHVLAEQDAGVGGDLIDVYQFNNGSMAISVADISGKGSKAAARAALVKYALRAYVSAGLTPAQVLRNLNHLFMETSAFDKDFPDSFVSVIFGGCRSRASDHDLRVRRARAGGSHEPPATA